MAESTPRPGVAAASAPTQSPIAHRLAPWLLAIRPKTLTAAVAPVLVGSACAYVIDGFQVGPAVAALIGALLLQIASNLANDLIDYRKGLDTHDRLGPTRVVQAGLLSERAITIGLLVIIGLALLVGVYLTWVAGIAVIVIGIASILGALAYTGGPYPLGYHGFGDVAVFVFFGFVAVCGTAYVQALYVPDIAWWAAVPVGALATAILVVNNLRDIDTDARGGKRTLAVRLGRRATVAEYALLLAVAYVTPMLFLLLGSSEPWPADSWLAEDGFIEYGGMRNKGWLLPLITLPLGVMLFRRVARSSGRDLNRLLAATAQLLFLYGALFAAGIALSR